MTHIQTHDTRMHMHAPSRDVAQRACTQCVEFVSKNVRVLCCIVCVSVCRAVRALECTALCSDIAFPNILDRR